MKDGAPLLALGQIARAHGIKGEVSLIWHADTLPVKGMRLFVRQKNGALVEHTVDTVRMHKGRPLLFLSGIHDRTAAEGIQGDEVYARREDLPQPAEDEAWLADLVGMNVYLPGGRHLGRLDHVEFPANQQVWSIIDDNGREILFPAQECFLGEVDMENGRIIIDPPNGLLEVYNA